MIFGVSYFSSTTAMKNLLQIDRVKQGAKHFQTVKSGFFYGYIIIAIPASIMALFGGTLAAFGVFLKPLISELRWTRAMTSGAFSLSSIESP